MEQTVVLRDATKLPTGSHGRGSGFVLGMFVHGPHLCVQLTQIPSFKKYEGELKFFDNYIIPLAKKLKDCNVFGVSSDEVSNYAVRNRAEWEYKGKEIVEEFVAYFDTEFVGSETETPGKQYDK